MSLARLSAGAGYQYLLRHTACGDASREAGTELTAYYAESGYPPGTWFGAGLAGLGLSPGDVTLGSTVTEEAMARVFGSGHDPVTDRPLGRAYPTYRTRAQRVADAVALLPEGLRGAERDTAVAAIERVESARRPRVAVAGFDMTFTAPKSASVLWALADPVTQQVVLDAHHAAVRDVLSFVESRAVFTRVGARSCAQVPTQGMVAALFDHWDTRTGDPNLHTHVVIANRVQGLDGQWRTLDSRALHHAVVAISEVYDNLFADHLARVLPVAWEHRDRGPRRTPAFELAGLPDRLLAEFSTRSAQVDAAMVAAVADFKATRGRGPSRVETTQLRQRITRQVRPPKTARRLTDLMSWWRRRASALLHLSPEQITAGALRHRLSLSRQGLASAMGPVRGRSAGARPASRGVAASVDSPPAAVVSSDQLTRLAVATLSGVMARRSTWTRWNLLAEAARATREVRCASVGQRHVLHDQVVDAALAACVGLASPEIFTVPSGFQRPDGSSVFTRADEDPYTHPLVLEAEARLLDALEDRTAPSADAMLAASVAAAPQPLRQAGARDVRLAADQSDAVVAIATSRRRIEVLVGPAGTGKTTTLAALRTVWEVEHGTRSVLGLAPSAAAAHELSAALGIPCENTAKWLHETTDPATGRSAQRRASLAARLVEARSRGDLVAARRAQVALDAHDQAHPPVWAMRAGMLVIVDEASLAGTFTLDALAGQARDAGAKLLLVGDHHQLSAVDAGGAFGLLAATPAARELTSLWRFTNRWEAHATRRLRRGDPSVIDTYASHDRLHTGTRDEMLDSAYTAWAADVAADGSSLLVAADTDTVAVLNQRAQHDRAALGLIDTSTTVHAADGSQVGVGDLVITRRNQRRLIATDGTHVRNGTRWRVTATHADGGLTLATARDGTTLVYVPGTYVRDHVELGYASTIHRAQGITVAHSHVIATPGLTREALYVAMTRGTSSNHAYLPLDHADPSCDQVPDPARHDTDARELLAGILATSGREQSATETLRASLDGAVAGARLRPIRDTLTGDTTPDPARPIPWRDRQQAVREIDRMLRGAPAGTAASETAGEHTTSRPTVTRSVGGR